MGEKERSLQLEAREHGFGATVRGLNLRAPLYDSVAEAIREAWAQHAVLVFPEQVLSHSELENFTLGLGDFGIDPFIESMQDHPNVLELRREPNEKAQNFGAAWHSDWSFQPCPPSGTILHSKVIPPIGGNTLYADGHRAWEALSNTMKSMLERLRAIHSAAFAYGPRGVLAKDAHERTMKDAFRRGRLRRTSSTDAPHDSRGRPPCLTSSRAYAENVGRTGQAGRATAENKPASR